MNDARVFHRARADGDGDTDAAWSGGDDERQALRANWPTESANDRDSKGLLSPLIITCSAGNQPHVTSDHYTKSTIL